MAPQLQRRVYPRTWPILFLALFAAFLVLGLFQIDVIVAQDAQEGQNAPAENARRRQAPAQQQRGHSHAHRHVPFEFGDELKLECVLPDANGTVFVDQFGELIYGPGPICSETGETWTFHYGIETNIICRWHVDQSLYNFLKMVIQGQAVYRCRLKMSKDGSVYMPFPVAIWGGVEPAHIHCMNHYSWNFHASEGYLVGGAAYPLRDHYQLLEVGSLLTIHGPVKWFAGHSYEPLKPPAGATTATPSAVAAPPAESAAKAAEPAPDPAEQQPAAKPTLPPKPVPEPPAVTPQIPIQPIPNMNELSTRACKYGYGYYEPFIVGLYCFLSSVATGGLCFLFYVSFVKGEGASAGRKTK